LKQKIKLIQQARENGEPEEVVNAIFKNKKNQAQNVKKPKKEKKNQNGESSEKDYVAEELDITEAQMNDKNNQDVLVLIMRQLDILQHRKKFQKIKLEQVSHSFVYSTSTSKKEYIFPTIIFSFLNHFHIPHEKMFSSGELKQFEWARKASPSFKFYQEQKELEFKNLDTDFQSETEASIVSKS
jgi:hypothetical protein